MKLIYTSSAAKQFAKLPISIQQRIAEKMRFYLAQPDPLAFAKPLTSHRLGSHRYRIGEYRVLVDFRRDTALVVKIAKRDLVYQ